MRSASLPSPLPSYVPTHPVVPTEEVWAAMTPAERERFIEEVNASFSTPQEVASEGRPHKRAKNEALDALSLHFASVGRVVYLADELSVLYPGQESFVPDILAVVGVAQPADDPRTAWVVATEKRGLDLVIEVLHSGNRQKDLVRNVAWYAALGIQEYFVYDRLRQKLHGFRLQARGGIYEELRPHLGRLTSQVLGLDLALAGERLRFYAGHAELIGSPELIERLSEMLDRVEARADEEAERAKVAEKLVNDAREQAWAAEEQVRLAEEQARSAAEQVRLAQEQTRSAQEQTTLAHQQTERAIQAMQDSLLAILSSRQVPVPDEASITIRTCTDPTLLQTWIVRALTAEALSAILA